MQHKAWPGTDHRLVRGSEVRRIEEAVESSGRDEYKERFYSRDEISPYHAMLRAHRFLEVQCVHSRLHSSDI